MPDFKSTATVDSLFGAAETRISCYSLTNESTIPDSRIQEIVEYAVKHAPSSFNVQSTRAVVLVKKEHEALWDIADRVAKIATPEKNHDFLAKMVKGFKESLSSRNNTVP